MAIYNKITEEEIQIICSGKYNSRELSILLKRNKETITKIAREQNFKLPSIPKQRKYYINPKVFNEWNIESAYWLGFVYADGYVVEMPRNGGALIINLQIKDISILERLQGFLQTNTPIYHYNVKQYKCCRLTACSRELYESLLSKGLFQNKTYRLTFPQNIPDYLIPHFIRGYFDGDGCAIILKPNNSGNQNLCIEFVGQWDFLSSIKSYYNTLFNNDFGCLRHSKNGNYSTLSFRGIKSSIPLGCWLYEHSSENNRLNRKYEKVNNFILENIHKLDEKRSLHDKNNIKRNNKLKWSEVKIIREKYDNNETIANLAREYKVGFTTIRKIVRMESWLESDDFYVRNGF